MKKKISLTILSIGCIFVAIILLFMALARNNPLEKYDFANCKVGIYDYEGTEILEYLSDEECDNFIEVLQQVEVSNVGTTDYKEYSGRHKNYCIELESGKSVDISCAGNYLVIGELGYKMAEDNAAEIRGALNIYWEQLFKKVYPINE